MPLRGVVLVLAVAIVSGIACRKEMYGWFRQLFTDWDTNEENKTDEEIKGEKEE